jgi:hypothetical protein
MQTILTQKYEESGIWKERRALGDLKGKVPFPRMVDRRLASYFGLRGLSRHPHSIDRSLEILLFFLDLNDLNTPFLATY